MKRKNKKIFNIKEEKNIYLPTANGKLSKDNNQIYSKSFCLNISANNKWTMARDIPLWQHSFAYLNACRPNFHFVCMFNVYCYHDETYGCWSLFFSILTTLSFISFKWMNIISELLEAMTSLLNISEQKSKLPVLSVLMQEIISIQSIADLKQNKNVRRIRIQCPCKNKHSASLSIFILFHGINRPISRFVFSAVYGQQQLKTIHSNEHWIFEYVYTEKIAQAS